MVNQPTREQLALDLIKELRKTHAEPVDKVWQRWQQLFREYDDAVLHVAPRGQYVEVVGRTLCVVCWRFDGEHDDMPLIGHVGTPQPTPSAEPMLLTGRCPSTSEHVPHVWLRDHGGPEQRDMQCPGIAEPPSIADMAPGTTLAEEVRWTVARDQHGNTFLYRNNNGYGEMRLPDQIDPSTIRDVVVPE